VFESSRRLHEDIDALLDAIRQMADGSYACVMEPEKILFESLAAGGEEEADALRTIAERRGRLIFDLPAAMAEDAGPSVDPFSEWEGEEICLVIVNDRVGLLVACPDAEGARAAMTEALRALVDRLLRLESRYRLDRRGRGFFFGSPKLDFVTIGRGQ
jgi:hypothetical protein